MLVVKRMLVDHKFTLLGPTASVGGFFLGPIYYYFMLPFTWAWQLDPAGPAVMVALFGVATVYLVFLVGKFAFDERSGLVAASLYALSPLVISYSRSSWNPNPIPFFAMSIIYGLLLIIKKMQLPVLVWIGIAAGIGLQLHYLFLFLFPVIGIWYWWKLPRHKLAKSLLITAFGFGIGFFPYLLFELRHEFTNTQSIIRFLLVGKETGLTTATFLTNIWFVPFRAFGRLLFRLPESSTWAGYPDWQIFSWFAATGVFLVGGLVYLFFLTRVKDKKLNLVASGSQLILLWFAAIVILFGFYRRGIYDYYFGIFFPLPFLVVGAIIGKLWQSRVWFFGVALFVSLIYWNYLGQPFQYPPNNQYAQMQKIAAAAISLTQDAPYNFALLTSGNSDHAYRFFFEVWGRPPVTIENSVVDPQRSTVTEQLIVICENPADCHPVGHPLWEIAGFGQAEIAAELDVPFVKIIKLVHYEEAIGAK